MQFAHYLHIVFAIENMESFGREKFLQGVSPAGIIFQVDESFLREFSMINFMQGRMAFPRGLTRCQNQWEA